MVCIQTDIEVEENRIIGIVVQVIVIIIVTLVVIAVVAGPTFNASGYKYG